MSSRSRRGPATPLPTAKIGLLGLVLLANNMSLWMIFSFLPFMVSHYYPNLEATELGFRAGLLGSAYSAGALIGNIAFGVFSDRYGRRPALLSGVLGTAFSAILFGFSPTFAVAALARFLWGMLGSGNIGVAKTYLAEICDDSNLARGMAYFGVIGGAGRVFGPMIGGLLSEPAKYYPVFRGTIFETYPFALPSLVISANCFLVFAVAYVYLLETLPEKPAPKGPSLGPLNLSLGSLGSLSLGSGSGSGSGA
mmetsp:Transcript_30505/g.65715  ORF Transcript_30505/g.65715 Transcript_30505/m.65715 type:complete len:252 (-) Transcript_30505:302-1057(-)